MQTSTTIREACERIVASHPDGQNDAAQNYYEDGAPCCIAGHVYDLLNALPECIEGSVEAIYTETPELNDWTGGAVDYLAHVQILADAGHSWAEAVERTNAYFVERFGI